MTKKNAETKKSTTSPAKAVAISADDLDNIIGAGMSTSRPSVDGVIGADAGGGPHITAAGVGGGPHVITAPGPGGGPHIVGAGPGGGPH